MAEMQRWKVIDDDLMRPDEQPHGIVPDEVFLEVVLAADAEAAIAAAEQRHADEDGLMQAQAFDYGERHMLAKCMAAVKRLEPDLDRHVCLQDALESLRSLQEQP